MTNTKRDADLAENDEKWKLFCDEKDKMIAWGKRRDNDAATANFNLVEAESKVREKDKEIAELKGVLDLKNDEYVQQVGTWKIISRLEEENKELKAVIGSRDYEISILRNRVQDFYSERNALESKLARALETLEALSFSSTVRDTQGQHAISRIDIKAMADRTIAEISATPVLADKPAEK